MLIILDFILAVGLNISEIECYLYNEAGPNWLKLFERTFEYLGGNEG